MSAPVDGAAPPKRPSAARERLLSTATRVFYAEGIHGVGVDRIIAEANITRATFYRHFPGKEDLVRAYLADEDRAIRERLARAAETSTTPGELIGKLIADVGDEITGEGFRGDPFVNAAAEYPDPEHPVHQVILEHRVWFLQAAGALLGAAGHPDPQNGARTLLMLRDGAMVAADLEDPDAARESLERAARALLAAG